MTKPPRYDVGQRIALRWSYDTTSNCYLLRRADGTLQGTEWYHTHWLSMQLPRVLTIWCWLKHMDHRGQHFTLARPAELGGGTFALTLDDLRACDMQLAEE